MITYSFLSKAGSRTVNEDCVGSSILGEESLFAVADGLGGHWGGEIASGLAIACTEEIFQTVQERSLSEQLAVCFQYAQDKLLERQEEEGKPGEIKTTLVLFVQNQKQAAWGHIGDSRLYYFKKHRLKMRTYDHSVPQMLVDTGQLRETEIRNHPDRNRILRVLGTPWEEPRYELSEPMPLKSGDRFLLCTDGFWELITEKQMTACLRKANTPQQWLEQMEEIVLETGKNREMDNYSALSVWFT